MAEYNLSKAFQLLTLRFSENELQNFCFELEVDYEGLSGTGKDNKARELLQYLERRARLNDLVHIGRQIRPDVPWNSIVEQSQHITPRDGMRTKYSRKKLRTSARKHEVEMFRQIINYETTFRGLLMHSEGKGGVGKSTLLKMFEDQCQAPLLKTPTACLYFNAERFLKWQTILDKTARKVGTHYFPNYMALSTQYNIQSSHKHRVTSNNVQLESAFYDSSGENSESSQTSSGKFGKANYAEEAPISTLEEVRINLIRVFLQDLNRISEPIQLVWLVDTAEKLDEGTKAWLTEIFWQIAEGDTERLVLVVAGRNRLRYEPQWIDKIADISLSIFSKDIIMEVLQPMGSSAHINLLADLLIEKSQGRPLEVITYLEDYLSSQGVGHD